MKNRAKTGLRTVLRPAVWGGLGILVLAAVDCLVAQGEDAQPLAAAVAATTQPAAAPVAAATTQAVIDPAVVVAKFHSTVEPILKERCYDCHAGTDNKTGVAFDQLTTDASIANNPDLWLKVLRITRSHIMPPTGSEPPTHKQQLTLENWIEYSGFAVDPANLDPGRQTVRRLNRTEYHNTVQDLIGVDYDTDANFPADDIGYGFDNIGDVLNVSQMLMEKYMSAAQTIVMQVVPQMPRVMPVVVVQGTKFSDTPSTAPVATGRGPGGGGRGPGGGSLDLSFFTDSKTTHTFKVAAEGDYKIVVDKDIRGQFGFNSARCTVTYSEDDEQLLTNEYGWKEDDAGSDEISRHWMPGSHHFTITLHPTVPPAKTDAPGALSFRVLKVQLQGPMDESKWNPTPGYDKFFTHGEAPADPVQRRAYASEILKTFATKAFRRPVPDDTLNRLVDIAQGVYDAPGGTFEKGVSQAMIAILASPRFLYRIEAAEPVTDGRPFANVDEYSLASRLSYFFWSTMPDDELMGLAGKGQLRKNLVAQVNRMIADPRSKAMVTNFIGQWLQSREVATVAINPREIMLREGITLSAGRGPGGQAPVVAPAIRTALQEEPEAYFSYIMHDDRSVKELIDSNYIFVNQTLATFYQLKGVTITGDNMRKLVLPEGDLRGGVITMGAPLMVTSNPTRTSPVKRGKWILENLLGAPLPPPPPNVPALEQTQTQMADKKPTLRQVLETHRADPTCASCHARMDPLGLALENFNAEGLYRSQELNQPIDPAGQLYTGETFKDVTELKQALVKNHLQEFYRCITEKLLIYATGRGMDDYDMPTIDKIADRLDREDGRCSSLILGVIESAPFQEQRVAGQAVAQN